MDICFSIDMLLNFFTAYFDDDDILISSRCAVIKNYLKFWFWVDFMSVFPLQLIFNFRNFTIFLRFSKLPKLYKITKISKLMRTARATRKEDTIWTKVQNFIRSNPGIDRILINLFSIVLSCHLLACLWHYLATMDEGIDNWIV